MSSLREFYADTIKQNQKKCGSWDPEGNTEVSVGNIAIYFLTREPGYYDGSLQVLTQDHSKDPDYNITGAKYVRSGSKIVLHTMSVRDVLWDNPDDAVIDYSELSEDTRRQYEESDNATRQASRDCEKKCEMDFFFAWAKKKATLLNEDLEDLRDETDRFYDANFNPNDPLKVMCS